MDETREKMWVEYPSKVSEIVSKNRSFDSCVLRVCYPGKNQNKTSISRNAIESAIPTIYYCPIVCNYDVETDEIGGHDVDIVSGKSGFRMVHLTDPIGVIPEGATYYWETVDDDGVEHEYLCIEGLLWKRSPAYSKIKRDGITAQSMEIAINSGKCVDGIYEIYDFDFTAFCLLGDGIAPCFESASLETYSLEISKARFSKMMEDLRAEHKLVAPAHADEIHNYSKGGNEAVDDLLAKYGLSSADIDFDTSGMSPDEIESRFAAIADRNKNFNSEDESEPGDDAADDAHGEDVGGDTGEDVTDDKTTDPVEDNSQAPAEPDNDTGTAQDDDDGDDNQPRQASYSLTENQLSAELSSVLRAVEKIYDDVWREEVARYWYIDHDCMLGEVYFLDRKEGYNTFGAPFTMNGDAPVIDLSAKKRKKVAYVDFEDGATIPDGASAYAEIEKYAKVRYSKLEGECEELRSFKSQKDCEQRKADEDALFAKFSDLNGNADFDTLRNDCSKYTLEQLEDKCFAIRGRSITVNFSANSQSDKLRLPIDCGSPAGSARTDEPYGGVFLKYGFGSR